MTLNEYQHLAARTIDKDLSVTSMTLHALHGMTSENGELNSIYQKAYQGHEVNAEALKKELGDLLWFAAEYCTAQGWQLDDICQMNIDKLIRRYPDGFSPIRSLNRAEDDT